MHCQNVTYSVRDVRNVAQLARLFRASRPLFPLPFCESSQDRGGTPADGPVSIPATVRFQRGRTVIRSCRRSTSGYMVADGSGPTPDSVPADDLRAGPVRRCGADDGWSVCLGLIRAPARAVRERQTLGATFVRDDSPVLGEALFVAGRRGARGDRGRRVLSERRHRLIGALPLLDFSDSPLEPTVNPATAAGYVPTSAPSRRPLGTTVPPSVPRNFSSSASRVLESRLDTFPLLAGQESQWRTADPCAKLPQAVRRYEAAAGRELPRATSLPSYGAVK